MRYMVFASIIVASLLASAMAQAPASAPAASLIANGDFEMDKDGNGVPDGWPAASPTLSWENENGNHFMRLKVAEPGKLVTVYRSIDLKPEDKAFEFSFRVKYESIKPGAQPWFDGRIMINFKDAQKQVVKGGPSHPNFKGTNTTWQQRTIRFKVPEGATLLEFMPSLFQAEAGSIDFDDLRLVRIDPSAVPAK